MWRATIAGLRAHPFRLLSTALAVVAGVAFVCSTYVMKDTMTSTFDDLFGSINEGIDVIVNGAEEESDNPGISLGTTVPQSVVDQITTVEGVNELSREAEGLAILIDEEGNPIGGMGPPTLAFGLGDVDLGNIEIRAGRRPENSSEVMIDNATFEKQEWSLGQRIMIVVNGADLKTCELVGTYGFAGGNDSMAGATTVIFDQETAIEYFAQDGFQTVSVVADEGVGNEELRDRISAVIGDGYEVRTSAEATQDMQASVAEGLGFFQTALLVFAAIALFVGAFLIFNTFSIIVAQRTRELALLRAIGASRTQVMSTVVIEAFLTGLLGAVFGFLLGIGLAQGLFALFDLMGVTMPAGDLVVKPATFIIALVLGVVVTVVVAIVPAFRSTRVPPVAAMQAVVAPPRQRTPIIRYGFGGVLFLGGVAGLVYVLSQNLGLQAVGVGAVATLLGAAMLAPLVTKPLLIVLGAPLRRFFGVPGELATENALRSPQRTASTASALMIGLALVSFMAILSNSLTQSALGSIDKEFAGDVSIVYSQFLFVPEPDGMREQFQSIDGVEHVVRSWNEYFTIDDDQSFVTVIESDSLSEIFTLNVTDGDQENPLKNGAIINESFAEKHDLSVGDQLEIESSVGETITLNIDAVYEDSTILAQVYVSSSNYDDLNKLGFGGIELAFEDGVDSERVRSEVDEVMESYPTYTAFDKSELKDQLRNQVNQLLGIITALLGLSVLIALFGIVNTLGLSVFERTREIGLLRAVGSLRGQVRAMIRWEAILIAILGAVFGITIGVIFAAIVLQAFDEDLTLVIPWLSIVGGLVAAGFAGVIAAVIPSFRASQIDVLTALQSD